MNAPWRVQLFEKLCAQNGDLVVTRFATTRVAALLIRLTLFPQRTHPREELIELLWPEIDLDSGRRNLRVALSSLRRQLEPPHLPSGSVLIADRSSIRLNPAACGSDAAEFDAACRAASRAPSASEKRQAWEQAAALFGGELAPGFYDDWIIEERERLNGLHEDAQRQSRSASFAAPSVPSAAEVLMPETPVVPCHPARSFPLQFTRFFGRSSEQAQIGALLRDPQIRLITLVGPGGSGKTRLAQEVARREAEEFEGPVCFVSLADLLEGHLVPGRVADALRLTPESERTPSDQIAAHLAGVRALLVLDNLEQLGESGAFETRRLLELTPTLTCLVTSRQKLDLEGEREMPILPLPTPSGTADPAQLAQFPSVQLFVDRAQAIRPDFQITTSNAGAVAAVCRHLEGLPLALELAAARVQGLTPAQMQEQLQARLQFLTSRRGDLPPRHRSLRATLEWSVQLLTPEQARFFRQLSIFRGGWSLAGAGAVCGVSDPLSLLEQMCERSLVFAEEGADGMRFRMLESLREFGDETLSVEERQEIAQRHAAYYAQLAVRLGPHWSGAGQACAAETLDEERENLRAALGFCRSTPSSAHWDGGETGLRLAGALADYWSLRGQLGEGLEWLEQALTRPGSPAARAQVLTQIGRLASSQGMYTRAEAALDESIALYRNLDDILGTAVALRVRGVSFCWQEEHLKSSADLEEALLLSRRTGDAACTASILNALGVLVQQWQSDMVRARDLYEEALIMFRQCGNRQWVSYCLHNIGNIVHEFGDHVRAQTLMEESLDLAEEMGDVWQRAYCLRSLGEIVDARGDMRSAVRMLEESRTLCRQAGDRRAEAGVLCSLGSLARRQGNPGRAETCYRDALEICYILDEHSGPAECWVGLAELAVTCEQWTRAASMLGAISITQEKFLEAPLRVRVEAAGEAVRAALKPEVFAAAWARGQTLTPRIVWNAPLEMPSRK